ncbi:hypothetical protein AAF712_014664 [Marasmius tenuissimus]|uniref:DDE-1 domain-containing protein n=1 Tax=Marasmius tenuissimus TaxID=585030 RepID=A0ABR2ZCN9_9AGAR
MLTELLDAHPKVNEFIKERLIALCNTKASISLLTVKGVILAMIKTQVPKLLAVTRPDGSTFCASDSWLRKWLAKSILWDAYIIKDKDISAALVINSDQTQFLYAPGGSMTYMLTGSKQVEVIGMEDKRAITVVVSVASDRTVLPWQAIYAGLSDRSCPSPKAEGYSTAIEQGHKFVHSGSKTYWLNLEIMKKLVDNILIPYRRQIQQNLHLPTWQKMFWKIDVYSVHRSRAFGAWMRESHLEIKFSYVPGGCTPVGQPCDVAMQRPFKLAAKHSYHADVVNEFTRQLEAGEQDLTWNEKLGALGDGSIKWLLDGFKAINNLTLVKKVLLLTACTLDRETAQKLRELRETDRDFWEELKNGNEDPNIPEEDAEVVEDSEEICDGIDDSKVPLEAVIDVIINPGGKSKFQQLIFNKDGGFSMLDPPDDPDTKEPVQKKEESDSGPPKREQQKGNILKEGTTVKSS